MAYWSGIEFTNTTTIIIMCIVKYLVICVFNVDNLVTCAFDVDNLVICAFDVDNLVICAFDHDHMVWSSFCSLNFLSAPSRSLHSHRVPRSRHSLRIHLPILRGGNGGGVHVRVV